MLRKEIKIFLVSLVIFIAVLEIFVVASNSLFFEKISAKEVAKRSMPQSTANAVKHAYASSLVYSALRTVFFTEEAAKNVTIFLGKTNEIAEIIFKPQKDSTLEMMKDLENNFLGICAAQLIEENENNPAMDDRISLIGNLAQRNKLILSNEDLDLDEPTKQGLRSSSNYFVAVKWLAENQHKFPCNFNFDAAN